MLLNKEGHVKKGALIGLIVLAVIALIVVMSCFTTIPAGHTGVILTFGKAGDTVLDEGLHFKIPFMQSVVTVDNRIVKLDVATEAFSKDLQTINVDVAVNYHIGKDAGANLYKEVGLGYEDVLLTPAVNEVLKAVTAKYTAVELVSSRQEVSVLLDEGINEKLNEYGIYINELNIINWDFSEEYISAIEAKQVAEQNLIKTKTEQEQALLIANTEAEKRVIAAEAEANEIRVLAEAKAESNRIIAESLTEEVLTYQTIAAWDGALPKVTGAADTIIDLSSMMGNATGDSSAEVEQAQGE